MKDRKSFDDNAQAALQLLLDNFWILRERNQEAYQLIRDRETVLRDYVLDKLGYRLIIHRHFAKLEKIPAIPEAWMGIQAFQHPRDYAMFSCMLAFLENKAVDEQFLLTHVCEELEALYPGNIPLDWTHYEHRKSLVRVLQVAVELGVLHVVDGDTAAFHFNEASEALYEVSVVARYFMRSYPKDLFQFSTKEEILATEIVDEEQAGAQRRHRVYRQLMLSPALYKDELDEADFHYLVQYRNRLQDDIEKHTGMQLELYRQTALLIMPERKHGCAAFPDTRAISDIALQFAQLVRGKYTDEEITLNIDGSIMVTPVEFEQWIGLCKMLYGYGWSKQYREALIRTTASELLRVLMDWKMASVDRETGVIALRPALGRLAGEYPRDFSMEKGEKV
ncbi:MAG: TIGR02678 family protein, partial [Paenibacillaceae bacterium]